MPKKSSGFGSRFNRTFFRLTQAEIIKIPQNRYKKLPSARWYCPVPSKSQVSNPNLIIYIFCSLIGESGSRSEYFGSATLAVWTTFQCCFTKVKSWPKICAVDVWLPFSFLPNKGSAAWRKKRRQLELCFVLYTLHSPTPIEWLIEDQRLSRRRRIIWHLQHPFPPPVSLTGKNTGRLRKRDNLLSGEGM